MASSRVESLPYGCVLRDRNLQNRDRDRETNVLSQASFQKNLKGLVRGHLHNIISLSSPRGSEAIASNENSPHGDSSSWDSDDAKNNHNLCDSSSKRQSGRILERWASRQARELITTNERQTHEAELLALSNSHPVSTRAPSFLRESSPATSDCSVDVPNLRASSLVQMWKEFEAERRLSSRNRSISLNSNSTVGRSTIEMDSSVEEQPSLLGSSSEVCDSFTDVSPVAPEDSPRDWESDQMTPSVPRSSLLQEQERASDAGESDGGRVANIIRRLTSASGDDSEAASSPDSHTVSDHGEHRGALFIGNHRPCVRGRQAILNLLMQMESERQMDLTRLEERRAVSQFSQRGRIQSLLRLRLLQHKVAVQNQPCPASTASELDSVQPQGATRLLPRERYRPQVEQDHREALNGDADSRSSRTRTHLPNNTFDSEHSGMSNQFTNEDIQHQEVTRIEQARTSLEHLSVPSTTEDLQQEEESPSSGVTWQGTSSEVRNADWLGPEDDATTTHGWEGGPLTEETDPDNQQVMEPNGRSWLSDFSPPQRDWGSLREAWNQEMLASSDNEEIRKLLERRTVSTFLASDLRERMDRLIVSQLQRQRHEAIVESAEEEDYENNIEHHYHEVSDDSEQVSPSLQLPLPSGLQSWNHYQDHEVSEDSNQVASTSLQRHLPSQSYYQDNRKFSPLTRRPSLEMELIYDLRGYMAQLHNEISEMRKSIDNCTDMQVKLQHCIKHEVAAALCHSVRGGETMELFNSEPKRKGSCFICYEMQIDSLLYRCGHMCTCFKCAHELQWSSGRCPICRAPIVDVVRAYSDLEQG